MLFPTVIYLFSKNLNFRQCNSPRYTLPHQKFGLVLLRLHLQILVLQLALYFLFRIYYQLLLAALLPSDFS